MDKQQLDDDFDLNMVKKVKDILLVDRLLK